MLFTLAEILHSSTFVSIFLLPLLHQKKNWKLVSSHHKLLLIKKLLFFILFVVDDEGGNNNWWRVDGIIYNNRKLFLPIRKIRRFEWKRERSEVPNATIFIQFLYKIVIICINNLLISFSYEDARFSFTGCFYLH